MFLDVKQEIKTLKFYCNDSSDLLENPPMVVIAI
jgi:hypothetical protein